MLQDQEVILTDMRILSQSSVLILTIIGAINYSRQCSVWQLSLAKPQRAEVSLIKFEGIKGLVFYFCSCVFKPL